MKKILFIILGIYISVCSWNLQAQETDEKLGLIPKNKRHEYINSSSGLEEYAFNLYLMYKHFNDKYPGELIDQDFHEEVARMFPKLNPQEVYDREDNIRFIIKNYRGISKLIDEAKEQMLVPKAPPIILEDDEYDTLYTGEYIENDKLVVILDPKKVVGYGPSKVSFEAAEAKFKRDNQTEVGRKFEELKSMLAKLEITKIPFYGVVFEDPFSGKQGIGEWAENDKQKIRIISEKTKIEKEEKIRLGLDIFLDNKNILKAGEKDFAIDFGGSENISGFELEKLMPQKYYDFGEEQKISGYRGNFLFPLTATVVDVSKPVVIKATIKANICNEQSACKILEFVPKLELENGKSTYSAMNNYIRQSFNILPKTEAGSLELKKLIIEEHEDKPQVLRIDFKAKGNPALFDVFVESVDGIELLQPSITVMDGKISARFEAANSKDDLLGKKFVVSAKLNDRNIIRKEMSAQKPSFFDVEAPALTFGMIMLGMIGGFILNFMPCVFPVLSIKMLGLTKFGAAKKETVRRGFLFTLLGIILAFGVIIILLISAKSLGYAIGWGMQFQNTAFLVVISFILVLFIAQISGFVSISTPNWVDKLLRSKSKKEDLLSFLTGLLLVLLATPCSAPYLGTAIGFALAGSNANIVIILSSVGFGLAIPYLLLLLKPDLAYFMPHPGSWVRTLDKVMKIMLLLTIIWLVSIVSAQTNLIAAVYLAVCLFLFFGILWFRKILNDTTERQKTSAEIKSKVMKLFNTATTIITAFLIIFSIYYSGTRYNIKRSIIASTKLEQINKEKIDQALKQNKLVLLSIGADWCLTCKFNEITVLDNFIIEDFVKRGELEIIEIDWTNYNKDILDFMEKYGRKGLPFYVIYSPKIPNGMVLPEILTEKDLSAFIRKQRF